MKHILLLIAAFFSAGYTFAQNSSSYQAEIYEANSLLKEKNYSEAILHFKKASALNNGKYEGLDSYNLSCCFAMTKQVDSAFYYLNNLANEQHLSAITMVINDTDLTFLHTDKRWVEFTESVRNNLEIKQANYNWDLVHLLDSIHEQDQRYRIESDSIREQFGRESDQYQDHWDLIAKTDSLNLIIVENIINEHGWLGSDIISPRGNTTLFLVIQHADLDTQLKYLPLMRTAVSNGNASANSLALLEDRTSLRQGKHQIYGSQIYINSETGEWYLAPVIDPDNLDQRRQEVGLENIKDYLELFDIEWDLEMYKKKLPEYEILNNIK